MSLAAALSRADANLDAALQRLSDWIAIPSISADPVHAADCRLAASWLASELGGMGFETEVVDTDRHPVLLARLHRDGAPKVIFYGHYDVQPADPLDEWRSPPFEMTISHNPAHGQILVGRGTSDDKGQVMTFVEACRAMLETEGRLPVDLTLVIEGEEEIGSPNLAAFMRKRRDALAADMALACDTDMAGIGIPGITVSMRGLVHDELVVTCASHDLHSGVYGGAARNPLHVVSSIVAALHDAEGRVAIPGFYDGVEVPVAEEGSDDGFLAEVGLSVSAGDPAVSARNQTLFHPSVDVNGLWGGYSGVGSKTVIPSQAGLKLSFRLVPGQQPEAVRRQFRTFVEKLLPPDCIVSFGDVPTGCVAVRLDDGGELVGRAAAALEAEWGNPTAMIATGGTIPAVAEIRKLLGLDTLMVGFSHDDDMQHGPNEKFDQRSFHKGIRSWVRILQAIG